MNGTVLIVGGGLEVERLREDAAGADLNQDVLDRRLVDREADLAVRAAADQGALGFDGDLLLAAVGMLDLKTQRAHEGLPVTSGSS